MNATDEELGEVELLGDGSTIGWRAANAHIGVGTVLIELLGDKYLRSEVSRMRGKIKSDRRAAASAANGELGERPKKPLSEKLLEKFASTVQKKGK